MTVVAHISDLHFGREDRSLAEALLVELEELRPEVVVVSGDLTQRARRRQFAAARAFLNRIALPVLVVPGNHDVPLFDLARRLLAPLRRYRRFITDVLDPSWSGSNLVVQGLNTARSLTWKNGRISAEQIRRLRRRFEDVPGAVWKVVVTHHPFIPPPQDPGAALVGRGGQALAVAADVGVDLLLSGHLHLGYAADVRHHHVAVTRSMLAIQAGTAISTRVREHPNGYNVLRLTPETVELEVRSWEDRAFGRLDRSAYRRVAGEWRREG